MNKFYVYGYTKALLDFFLVFERYETAMSAHGLLSHNKNKFIRNLIDGMIASRADLIEHGVNAMEMVRMKDGSVKFRRKEQTDE